MRFAGVFSWRKNKSFIVLVALFFSWAACIVSGCVSAVCLKIMVSIDLFSISKGDKSTGKKKRLDIVKGSERSPKQRWINYFGRLCRWVGHLLRCFFILVLENARLKSSKNNAKARIPVSRKYVLVVLFLSVNNKQVKISVCVFRPKSPGKENTRAKKKEPNSHSRTIIFYAFSAPNASAPGCYCWAVNIGENIIFKCSTHEKQKRTWRLVQWFKKCRRGY